MTDAPDLSKSPRSKPRPAVDSGVHPAEAVQVTATAPAPAPGYDGLPVKAEKEPTRPLSTYIGDSTRSLIDEVVRERGFSIREVVELAVKNYWGQGK